MVVLRQVYFMRGIHASAVSSLVLLGLVGCGSEQPAAVETQSTSSAVTSSPAEPGMPVFCDDAVPTDSPAPNLTKDSPAEDVMRVVTNQVSRLTACKPGAFGLRPDETGRSIQILWKRGASVPDELTRYISTRPLGVDITLNAAARYDKLELSAAHQKLIASGLLPKISATRVALGTDGSGIQIGVSTPNAPDAATVSRLKTVAGIDDITIEPNTPEVVLLPATGKRVSSVR